MSNFKMKMKGSPSHLFYGPFDIERFDSMGLYRSKYYYVLSYDGNKLEKFERQREARHYQEKLITEYNKANKKIESIENTFIREFNLPEYPKKI